MADWEERVRVAAQRAKKQAERAAPIAKRRAEQAATVAQEQAVRGKAVVERRLAARQAEAEERRRWYLTESGPVYTAGYPDEAAMRAGIQAASEHGWRVEKHRNGARTPRPAPWLHGHARESSPEPRTGARSLPCDLPQDRDRESRTTHAGLPAGLGASQRW